MVITNNFNFTLFLQIPIYRIPYTVFIVLPKFARDDFQVHEEWRMDDVVQALEESEALWAL